MFDLLKNVHHKMDEKKIMQLVLSRVWVKKKKQGKKKHKRKGKQPKN